MSVVIRLDSPYCGRGFSFSLCPGGTEVYRKQLYDDMIVINSMEVTF